MNYVTFRRTFRGMPQRQPGAQVQSGNDETTIVLAFPQYNQQHLIKMQRPMHTYQWITLDLSLSFIPISSRLQIEKMWITEHGMNPSKPVCQKRSALPLNGWQHRRTLV
ncbi:uncharacterized protein Z519_05658 [Cladophialophora bantiana CBS 173.52]|uniref:Uncharacterized protein n=1 Tax=Cladophialophora bantiana (strain ATCC 10958 / CBS 173.52 / CDC B-1940 / NIH 8579) TaxID=1442370 RepID=A0A0D2G6V0_CLAB1|nr:uncharacterized protein Z519_05658 [Cladophialophora bantiana CBS 173.52]KIW94342.1 hypothetical protein Z519_05658 [Cladophialophora bantiana CBS 173.52]